MNGLVYRLPSFWKLALFTGIVSNVNGVDLSQWLTKGDSRTRRGKVSHLSNAMKYSLDIQRDLRKETSQAEQGSKA